MNSKVFSKTPTVTVVDNRGLSVREIAWHRHPDTPHITDERITRHQYNARGFLTQSADPRLHQAERTNFRYLMDLAGSVLCTVSADAGTTLNLNDAASRPFMAFSNINKSDDGKTDTSQAVTRTWQYENATLPGRPLSVTEQTAGKAAHITERFIYAGNSDEEKALNLAGQCVDHYDTAGLVQIDSIALTGLPLSVTRRLLKDADNLNAVADWKGEDASVWNDLLESEAYTTLTTVDTNGVVLTSTDAKGNVQRMAYDVAGQLSGSWLTLKEGTEQVIVKSVAYSAAGQKLREEHGNGVVTTCTYEPQTQRLIGLKTERPVGHAVRAEVLQDLRYEYDPVGNVLKVSNEAEEIRFWRNQKVVPENIYVYDSLYQLVSAAGREMASTGQQSSSLPSVYSFDDVTYSNYTRKYRYDRAGNLTQIRHSAPATNNSYTTDITVSDRSNRGVMSVFTEQPADVDALFTVGGLQQSLLPGQKLTWTPRQELLKVTPVARDGGTDDSEHYRYESNSQRILKVSRQKTANSTRLQRVVYLPGLELRKSIDGETETELMQVISVDLAAQAQVRVLHWETGRPYDIQNNQLRYTYINLTGSGSMEIDGEGHLISKEEYYPFGGTAVWSARSQAEADRKTIRYSGKERDATGLYYYGYRYYQPWAGRWLSSDPAGTLDGLNLFRMVRNNPVTLYDSDGQFPGQNLFSSGASTPAGTARSSVGPTIGVAVRLVLDSAMAGILAGTTTVINDAIYGTDENGGSLAPGSFTNPVTLILLALAPVIQEYANSFILSFLPELIERTPETGSSIIMIGTGNSRANIMVPLNMAGNYIGNIAGHYAGEAMGGVPGYLGASLSEFIGELSINVTESALLGGFFRDYIMIAPGIRSNGYREHVIGEARERANSAFIDVSIDLMVEAISVATENPFLTNLPNALSGVIGYLPGTTSRRRRFIRNSANNADLPLAPLDRQAPPVEIRINTLGNSYPTYQRERLI